MSDMDFQWTLQEIAQVVQGELLGEDATVYGVNTDSRNLQSGELFVALVGERYDAHNFVAQACQQGAKALVVSKQVVSDCAQILVEDTRLALGKMAKAWRRKFDIPVIAITGSNGKTTVKEMVSAIMNKQHETLSTQGNLNNDIGVPLTLLRIRNKHTCAVIEMGANHKGEIAYLSGLAEPTVALVNNAGPAHLAGFGSLQDVAEAKGEIYSSLRKNGTAIINADDRFVDLWQGLCVGKQVLRFGLEQESEISAKWSASDGKNSIELQTPWGDTSITLKLPGRHNVMNALAASAAALAAGASLFDVSSGLQSIRGVVGRLQIKNGIAGSRIIDDTYNANPESLHAALDVLKNFEGRHFLALGDMNELGNDSERLHYEAGEAARDSGVDRLYTVGDLAQFAVKGFGDNAQSYISKSSMISDLHNDLDMDVTLLIKGSRLAKMEQVVQALTLTEGKS